MLYICTDEKDKQNMRGRKVPSFFLISKEHTADNAIHIIIDGDNGVKVEDCMFISRAIEHQIDRDEHDFSLQVMSAGAQEPLTNKRQYKKNLGRVLAVKTQEDSFEGKLTEVNEDTITLEWKAREPKPVGKGKVTVQKKERIDYDTINEAKVIIKF